MVNFMWFETVFVFTAGGVGFRQYRRWQHWVQRLCSGLQYSTLSSTVSHASIRFRTTILLNGSNHADSHCRLLAKQNRLTMMRNAVWALSNLCRGKNPPPDFAKVKSPSFISLQFKNNLFVLVLFKKKYIIILFASLFNCVISTKIFFFQHW